MFQSDNVTRLDDLLHFGQLFQASGNNFYAQITHILGNFCKGVQIFYFSSKIMFGNFYRHLATFYWSHCNQIYSNLACMNIVDKQPVVQLC